MIDQWKYRLSEEKKSIYLSSLIQCLNDYIINVFIFYRLIKLRFALTSLEKEN